MMNNSEEFEEIFRREGYSSMSELQRFLLDDDHLVNEARSKLRRKPHNSEVDELSRWSDFRRAAGIAGRFHKSRRPDLGE